MRDSRQVFGRRDFEISPRSRRESRRESRRVFGRRDFGNLAGQKLAEILVKILQGSLAADFFPFPGGTEEHAWGEPKSWGEVGRE